LAACRVCLNAATDASGAGDTTILYSTLGARRASRGNIPSSTPMADRCPINQELSEAYKAAQADQELLESELTYALAKGIDVTNARKAIEVATLRVSHLLHQLMKHERKHGC